MMIANVCIYLLVLALSVLSAVCLDDTFGYTPLLTLAGLTLLSLLYTLIVRSKVSLQEKNSGRFYVRGAQSVFTVEMRNRSQLFIPFVDVQAVSGREKVPLRFSIFPKETSRVDTNGVFEHIGRYAVGIKRVWFYDLLGVFRLPGRNMLTDVSVVPRLVEIGSVGLRAGQRKTDSALSEYSKQNENEVYNGVREYVPGDSLKNIHWKLTAHAAAFMSRRYEASDRNSVSVFLALTPHPYDDETRRSLYDCLVETALSAALYSVVREFDAELGIEEGGELTFFPLSSADDVRQIAPVFSSLALDGKISAADMIRRRVESKEEMENAVVCTANLTRELADLLGKMADRNINVAVYHVVPRDFGAPEAQDIYDFLRARGVECRRISSAEQLALPAAEKLTV